jgi:hypothetical protein
LSLSVFCMCLCAPGRMDALEVLHRAEQAGLKGLDESLVEGAIFLLDVVAFWGYMVYPLDYFFPDEALYHKLIPGFPGECRGWARGYPGHVHVMWRRDLPQASKCRVTQQ